MRPKNSTIKTRQQDKKGQAALEYIITYGWGFVVILVVLGALAYFGYLNPSRYVPSRCSFGVQLECVDYKLEARGGSPVDNGNITVVLRNNFGADINITTINTSNRMTTYTPFPTPVRIKRGESKTISFLIYKTSIPPVLIEKERISVPITITFQRDSAGAPLHNVTGEMFATIQKRS